MYFSAPIWLNLIANNPNSGLPTPQSFYFLLWMQNILMKFSLNPKGIHFEPRLDTDWTQVRAVLCLCLLLICHHFLCALYSINAYHFTTTEILPKTILNTHIQEKTTPFSTYPFPYIPDQMVPQIKQNIAPWPDIYFGVHGLVREYPMTRVTPIIFSMVPNTWWNGWDLKLPFLKLSLRILWIISEILIILLFLSLLLTT